MLTRPVVEEIHRLLAEGQLSQRQIAARLRVSRGIVGLAAHGVRGRHGREPAEVRVTLAPERPAQRCRRCGYLVISPCLICRARDYQRRHGRLPVDSRRGAAIGGPLARTRRAG